MGENVYLTTKFILKGKPAIFRRDEARHLLRSVIVYYKAQHHFQLYGYCFLPDRVQLVLQPGRRAALPTIMKHVWGNFARRVNKRWNWRGGFLRTKYLSKTLHDTTTIRATLTELHAMPLLHGVEEAARATPVSSALNYRKRLGDMFVDLYEPREEEVTWPVERAA